MSFEGRGVSFEGRGVSFEGRGVSFEVALGVVGVSGAFSLLPDRDVTAVTLLLCRGNFLGVPGVPSYDDGLHKMMVYSLDVCGRMLSADFDNLSAPIGLIDLPVTSTRPPLVESREDTV